MTECSQSERRFRSVVAVDPGRPSRVTRKPVSISRTSPHFLRFLDSPRPLGRQLGKLRLSLLWRQLHDDRVVREGLDSQFRLQRRANHAYTLQPGLCDSTGCAVGLFPPVSPRRGAYLPRNQRWASIFGRPCCANLSCIPRSNVDYSCNETTDDAFSTALVSFMQNISALYAHSPGPALPTRFFCAVGLMSPTKPLNVRATSQNRACAVPSGSSVRWSSCETRHLLFFFFRWRRLSSTQSLLQMLLVSLRHFSTCAMEPQTGLVLREPRAFATYRIADHAHPRVPPFLFSVAAIRGPSATSS